MRRLVARLSTWPRLCIAPRRHHHDELGECGSRSRTLWTTTTAAVVLASDQSEVPPQQCVRRHDAGDAAECLPTEGVSASGEPSPPLISEPESMLTQLRAQNSVLFEEVVEDLLLATADPRGHRVNEEVEGERVHPDDGSRIETRRQYLPDLPEFIAAALGGVLVHYEVRSAMCRMMR